MTRSRRPSRTLLIAVVVAAALISAIVYFGLNPDPTVALVATAVFVFVGVVLYVFRPVHDVLRIVDVVAWLADRRRGGDDEEPGNR